MKINKLCLPAFIILSTCQGLFAGIIPINGWQFSEGRKNEWLPATVPGTVHQDLITNNKIENPFYGDNEFKQVWIEKTDWEYKTTFLVDEALLKNDKIDLVFEGLDTYGDVFLNGKLILSAENMFVGYDVGVKEALKKGTNELRVYFRSPSRVNLFKAENHPYYVPAVNEYDPQYKQRHSVFSRKAPFHFGWDWGPRIVTSGIWRPVYLRTWHMARVVESFHQLKKLTKSEASYSSQIEVIAASEAKAVLEILVNGKAVKTQQLTLTQGKNEIKSEFKIANPRLWWSNGLGAQPIYTITSSISVDNKPIDKQLKKLGVRTIEVVQEKDEFPGKTFKIRLNGVDVFMKGSNYIPSDNLIPRVSSERYGAIIKATKGANMNMLRVWGGAVYEDDRFYDLCDENGILIWQDFMFACAMSPGNKEHLDNMKTEFDYNVKRLRQHPSIALWCGNNENMETWFRRIWKEKYQINRTDSAKLMATYKTIFYDLIPQSIAKYDSDRFYWPCSPGSEYEISQANSQSGDKHSWWIWFGKATYKDIADERTRFVSEYGLQSYPELKTIRSFAPAKDSTFDCYTFDSRQRSEMTWDFTTPGANLSKGNEMIKEYMDMYYREPKNFESFLYISQLMQAEGLKQIIEGNRRNKPYCWGSLYWQIDDCWPTISWATIDYDMRWKAGHYFVKKAYENLLVSPIVNNDGDKINFTILNDNLTARKLNLVYSVLNFDGDVLKTASVPLNVKANSSISYHTIAIKDVIGKEAKNKVVIVAELVEDGNSVSENILYLDLPKNLNLPAVTIRKKIVKTNTGFEITLESDKLAKHVYLKNDATEGFFSDNYFDLIPGKTIKVQYTTKANNKSFASNLKILHLQQAQQ